MVLGGKKIETLINLRFFRTISLLITIFSLNLPAHAKYSGGTGGPSNPYQISTAADLIQLSQSPEDYGKHFILIADINLDPNLPGRWVFDKAVIAPNTDETGLRYQLTGFSGVFNGNGHTISYLTISGISNLGLFGVIMEGAKISDLNLTNVDVVGTGGGIQEGQSPGSIGSLVGLNRGSVHNCHSTGSVISRGFVGGLVGTNYRGNVTQSSSTGYVLGKFVVGGLIGDNYRGNVTNCWSSSTVEGEDWVGGLIGENVGENFSVGLATVMACYSTGTVTGVGEFGEYYTSIGGLMGLNNGQVINSYSTCSVSGDSSVGGLIGDNSGYVTKCYSAGRVTINLRAIGGLIGSGWSDKVIDSFWDIDSSMQEFSVGGIGKTTTEMYSASTFLEAGWDLVDETENGTEDIWWITEGQYYPRLCWQHVQVICLYPENGASDVNQPIILNWVAGGLSLEHDVYFGEDIEEVTNATTESTNVYHVRQPAHMTTYDPGTLEFGRTYYWRIDEVSDFLPDSPWKGDVWSFSTSEMPILYEVVDDFENYDDEDHIIYNTWIDGRINGSGSRVGNISPPYAEQDIVHTGLQSMLFDYDNFGWPITTDYSEATANTSDLPIGSDWTKLGVTTLSLWFYGRPFNVNMGSVDELYVTLSSGDGSAWTAYHYDPTALRRSIWTEWNIALADFSKQGVNLMDVNAISIGIGRKKDGRYGGSGWVYLDDICLYRSPVADPGLPAAGPGLKLDFGISHNTEELEEGFTPFTIADSGSQVNGITIEFGGTLASRRRGAPLGVPFEQIYRDFIFSRPGAMTVKLSGLEFNTTYKITIYAWDSLSAGFRIADWTANGQFLCQTKFDSIHNPPVFEDDYAFTGKATADDTGTIFLQSAPGEGTREPSGNTPFSFLNALLLIDTEST
jgi:hypothetical protein